MNDRIVFPSKSSPPRIIFLVSINEQLDTDTCDDPKVVERREMKG